jgi:hypothetical protein
VKITPLRLLGGLLQLAAIAVALWFLVGTARGSWGTVELGELTPAWAPLLLASLIVVATSLYVVWWWHISLGWWGERLRYLDALRIFFVTNLARFIPGGVWQFAAVAAMVRPHRVSPVAATGAMIVLQVIQLATGLGLAVATVPAFLGSSAAAYQWWAPPVVALAGITLMAILLPRVIPFVGRAAGWITQRKLQWPSPGSHIFGAYAAGMAGGWVAYGLAFWLFGRSLLGSAAPRLMVAAPAYLAGYIAGMLAFFVPSGLLVREAALVVALSGAVGGGRALALAVGARLWLLLLEALTAVSVLVVHRVVRRARPTGADQP